MIGSSTLWFGVWPQARRDAPASDCSPEQRPRWLLSRAAVTPACWLGAGPLDQATPAATIASAWARMRR